MLEAKLKAKLKEVEQEIIQIAIEIEDYGLRMTKAYYEPAAEAKVLKLQKKVVELKL